MSGNSSPFSFLRRKPKPPKPEPLRTGIVPGVLEGGGLLGKGSVYEAVFDIAEWERLGSKSRISVLNVSGVPEHLRKSAIAFVPDWIDTNSATWRDE